MNNTKHLDATQGGSPQAWNAYFKNDPRSIAKDFAELNIKSYEDIAQYISSSKAPEKPDINAIYSYVQELQAIDHEASEAKNSEKNTGKA